MSIEPQRVWRAALFGLILSTLPNMAEEANRWQWAPLKCNVQVFPEVHVGAAIHEDVAVIYYTAKTPPKPLSGDLVTSIKEACEKHKIDPTKLPMAEQLGYMLLHDTTEDEYYMVIVQEHSTVIFSKAEVKFSEPPIYQPLHGRRAVTHVFHSEQIAKTVLEMKEVAVPANELTPRIEEKATEKSESPSQHSTTLPTHPALDKLHE